MLLGARYVDDGNAGIYLNAVQQNALAKFQEELDNKEYQFETYDCDCGCKYENLELIAQKDRYGLQVDTRICPICGLLMTNPRMTQESYNKFYDSLYRQLYVGRSRAGKEYYHKQREKGTKIIEYVKNKMKLNTVNSMLEIGCGAGGIVSVFKDFGIKKCKGIDLGSEYIQYGISMGQDLENINSLELAKRNEKYDLIIINHVLEHFLDMKNELEIIRNLLAENGVLFIEVPGLLDIHNGYQGNVLKYLQNAHVRHFTHRSLSQVMKWNGFDEIEGDETARGLYVKGCKDTIIESSYNEVLQYLKLTEEQYLAKEVNVQNALDVAERKQRTVEIFEQWMSLVVEGINICDCLKEKKIKTAAIYGWGSLGKQLYWWMDKANISVNYVIDKNPNISSELCEIYQPTDDKPSVDAIIITTTESYYEIKKLVQNSSEYVMTIQELIELNCKVGSMKKGEQYIRN